VRIVEDDGADHGCTGGCHGVGDRQHTTAAQSCGDDSSKRCSLRNMGSRSRARARVNAGTIRGMDIVEDRSVNRRMAIQRQRTADSIPVSGHQMSIPDRRKRSAPPTSTPPTVLGADDARLESDHHHVGGSRTTSWTRYLVARVRPRGGSTLCPDRPHARTTLMTDWRYRLLKLSGSRGRRSRNSPARIRITSTGRTPHSNQPGGDGEPVDGNDRPGKW